MFIQGASLYKGPTDNNETSSVSKEFIRQILSIANFSSNLLTVFPILLWELPVLNMKSITDFVKLKSVTGTAGAPEYRRKSEPPSDTHQSADTSKESNSADTDDIIIVENFLDRQVFVSSIYLPILIPS